MGYPETSNFVKNSPLRVVFSTLFLVFGYPDEALSLVFDILHIASSVTWCWVNESVLFACFTTSGAHH